jgi:hypothetical protein
MCRLVSASAVAAVLVLVLASRVQGQDEVTVPGQR